MNFGILNEMIIASKGIFHEEQDKFSNLRLVSVFLVFSTLNKKRTFILLAITNIPIILDAEIFSIHVPPKRTTNITEKLQKRISQKK